MVKFSFAPVALLAVLASTCVLAQEDSASSSVASSTMMASSTSAASSAAPTSMASSGGDNDGSSNVCTVLAGDPKQQPHGCPYSSTSTPPYDLSSLISYLIGGYTRGPEGKAVDEVAAEMADTVLRYYPTLTVVEGALQSSFAVAISNTINAIADGSLQKSDLAPASRNVPEHLIQYGVAVAAIVAAGAYAL